MQQMRSADITVS